MSDEAGAFESARQMSLKIARLMRDNGIGPLDFFNAIPMLFVSSRKVDTTREQLVKVLESLNEAILAFYDFEEEEIQRRIQA